MATSRESYSVILHSTHTESVSAGSRTKRKPAADDSPSVHGDTLLRLYRFMKDSQRWLSARSTFLVHHLDPGKPTGIASTSGAPRRQCGGSSGVGMRAIKSTGIFQALLQAVLTDGGSCNSARRVRTPSVRNRDPFGCLLRSLITPAQNARSAHIRGSGCAPAVGDCHFE